MNVVLLEKQLPDSHLQPDLTGMHEDEPVILLEVVDTHAPEAPVISLGLPIFQIHRAEDFEHQFQLFKSGSPMVATEAHNIPCPAPQRPPPVSLAPTPPASLQGYHAYEALAASRRRR